MKHLGDITKIRGDEAPIVDCITGGSPCQDLSVAGKRAGLDGERSGLFMEQIRIVKEMREHDWRTNDHGGVDVRPRYMVWENVFGAFSSNSGEDFRVVLEETARIADQTAVIPRPPQGKWSNAGCIMGDGWSLAWRLHDSQFWGVAQRRNRIALVADFGGGSAPEILFERIGVSGNIEQGGTERKTAPSGAGLGASETISFQERHGKPGGGKGILIQHEHLGAMSTTNNQYLLDNGIYKSATSRTLDLNGGNPSCNQGGLMVLQKPHAYGLDRASYNQGINAKYDFSIDEEKIGAQTAMGPGAVFSSIIRRITPKEAERLQGFPDDWTDIGEWTDSKGKKRKTSDAQRYKALGNSIATPFWFWLMRRISAQYYRPATLASLFDGIGGFPYCWERCNGSGTAIWASEIEEFPIAVTKVRFPERGDE